MLGVADCCIPAIEEPDCLLELHAADIPVLHSSATRIRRNLAHGLPSPDRQACSSSTTTKQKRNFALLQGRDDRKIDGLLGQSQLAPPANSPRRHCRLFLHVCPDEAGRHFRLHLSLCILALISRLPVSALPPVATLPQLKLPADRSLSSVFLPSLNRTCRSPPSASSRTITLLSSLALLHTGTGLDRAFACPLQRLTGSPWDSVQFPRPARSGQLESK